MRILLLLFLFTKIFCNPNDCSKYLLTVSQDSEGVTLSLASNHSSGHPNAQSFPQYKISTHQLSKECGLNFVHCQHLIVDSTHLSSNQVQHLIFIPLIRTLAIVELLQDSGGIHFNTHSLIPTSSSTINCSPSTLFNISNGYYIVCSNSSTNRVMMLEVLLNRTSLSSTTIVQSNSLQIPTSAGNITNSSNFLHVEVQSYEYVVFALGTAVYSMRPIVYISDRLGNVAGSCDHVRTLVHIDSDTIMAYCSDHWVTYSIGERDWLLQNSYEQSGRPFPCPNANMELKVFPNFIQYQINNVAKTLEISGSHFVSGICFGDFGRNHFAFRDANRGVFVANLESSELFRVSSSACGGIANCSPLVVVGNRYLVIRDNERGSGGVHVVDCVSNVSEIITTLHFVPDMAAVLGSHEELCDSNATTQYLPTLFPHAKDDKRIIKIILPVIGVLLLLLLLGVLFIFLILRYSKHLRRPYTTLTKTIFTETDCTHITTKDPDLVSIHQESNLIRPVPAADVMTPVEAADIRAPIQAVNVMPPPVPVAQDQSLYSYDNHKDTEPLLN